MVRNKSTRWDCDVRLWRGIPATTPSFYGWKCDDVSSVKDSRFYVCHHCNTYVPEEHVPGHPCWDIVKTSDVVQEDTVTENTDNAINEGFTDEEFAKHCENNDEEEEEVVSKYVIATEENENKDNGRCFLCKERLTLMYHHDEENWVYKDTIVARDKLVHNECHDMVSDQDIW